jgi:hypothetical protein
MMISSLLYLNLTTPDDVTLFTNMALKLLLILTAWAFSIAIAYPSRNAPSAIASNGRNITLGLFHELEELARIVDISYCVGTTGISKPFLCASRCNDFEDFELETVSYPSHTNHLPEIPCVIKYLRSNGCLAA